MKTLLIFFLLFIGIPGFSQTSNTVWDSIIVAKIIPATDSTAADTVFIRYTYPNNYYTPSPTDDIIVRSPVTKKRGLLSSLSLPLSTASINALASKSDASHNHAGIYQPILGFTPYNATNPNGYISAVPPQSFASLTGKPTTRAGYGITDAAADNHLHTGVYEPTITVLPFAKGGISGSAATSATTGTITVPMTSSIITVTPTGNMTFNATGGVAGQIVTFSITTSGVTSFVLTFGTNFRKTGTLATGTTSARFFTVTFRCLDGTTWTEIGRTAAQT